MEYYEVWKWKPVYIYCKLTTWKLRCTHFKRYVPGYYNCFGKEVEITCPQFVLWFSKLLFWVLLWLHFKTPRLGLFSPPNEILLSCSTIEVHCTTPLTGHAMWGRHIFQRPLNYYGENVARWTKLDISVVSWLGHQHDHLKLILQIFWQHGYVF